jgi:hypothetical protein
VTDAPIICSVLVPSRARYPRLVKTIDSVFATAADPRRVEVIVRLDDDDDEESIRQFQTLVELGRVSRHGFQGVSLLPAKIEVIVGPRRNGYASLSAFYEECADRARGAWLWVMNDDAIIDSANKYPRLDGRAYPMQTKRWDEMLAELSSADRIIIQPELYKLGGSGYWNCEGGAFPIVSKDCWRRVGHDHIGHPIDTWFDQVLRVQNGWRTHFLTGWAVVHDRDTDDVLAKHREIAPKP